MKWLAVVAAVAVVALGVALWVNSGSTARFPTTEHLDTPVESKRAAIDIVAQNVRSNFGDNLVQITAEHMTVEQATETVRDMGLGELDVGAKEHVGVPLSAPGYLVLVTGFPAGATVPDIPPGLVRSVQPAIQANWISETGTYVSNGLVYPSPTPLPGGSLIVHGTDWALNEAPDGNTLSLAVAVGGSCDKFDRIATSEDEHAVTVHAYVKSQSETGAACTLELSVQSETVQLDAPLGDRTLQGCNGYQIPLLKSAEPPVDCQRIGP
jgi:hypothetical protein